VMSSALVGASRPEQIEQCVGALNNGEFTADELQRIDGIAPA
jgi:L-glyceraldehyde 3-phosphate reductase